MFDRQESMQILINNYGLEKSKVSKMSSRDIQSKLNTFKNQIDAAKINSDVSVDSSSVVADSPAVPQDVQPKAPKQPKEPKAPKVKRVAEDDPWVLGFRVTVPSTGKTKIFALKYGFQDFGDKPYCQMIVDDVKMNNSEKFFVRTYNTIKTAQEHINKFISERRDNTENFLDRRDPDGYIGLEAIRKSEIKALQ